MTSPYFFIEDEVIYKNDKKALLDMCLRNAFKFAVGEMKYTMALHDQLNYAYANCNKQTRDLMHAVFKNSHVLEDLD